jgi:hypothetical protein
MFLHAAKCFRGVFVTKVEAVRNLQLTLAHVRGAINSWGISCLLGAKLLSGKGLGRWVYASRFGCIIRHSWEATAHGHRSVLR